MYKPDFRRKASNVPILSKQDIDHHGERFVQDFMPEAMKSPMPIDVDRFITKYLGLNLEYQYLSHCGAYLGMLVFNDTKRLPVFDPRKNEAAYIRVPANTVIVDNSLLDEENEHRYRFTGGHEAGHGIFHTQYYGYNRNQVSFFHNEDDLPIVKCRAASIQSAGAIGKVEFETDQDWMEWQANYFASALLMPKSMVKKLVEEYDGDDFSRDLLLAHIVSETFDVSVTAAANRLNSLNIITTYQP